MLQILAEYRERVAGDKGDSTIKLAETVSFEGGRRKGKVDNLRSPLTVPTIQPGVHDAVVVQIGSQRYTVVLAQGQVDGPTLAPSLPRLVPAVAPGI